MSPEAETIWRALKGTDRQVCRAASGRGWFLTHGDGPYRSAAVRELVEADLIRSTYSNCPDDSYHDGPTLDVDRTIAERKRLGRKDVRIHVGD